MVQVKPGDVTVCNDGEVHGILNSGTEDILNLYDGSTEVMSVIDGGNVGIGVADQHRLPGDLQCVLGPGHPQLRHLARMLQLQQLHGPLDVAQPTRPELEILGRGAAAANVYTCDFSYDYVKINADYRS